ncbi:Oidioi.mRNA.OKI2018_I69.chr2.g5132.t1.cds [Oikopleura dioica]|uniref:Oidioi.mRNA.OKI2018_I69.chr2.g5132.t1.cds n=1 Tax=Oikopleura dioica TaxID=34765 RepID=A0ABN7T2T7_OIKDI|nr:Oidioi.mRNA.OKI2018_I69.chr2.g5132.t1.cds [Oikopleura dioica]
MFSCSTECLYNINSIQVVNHYSHFYLLNELLENLKGTENDPARVVALSSKAHETALGDGKFWKIYSSPDEMVSSLGTGIKNIGVQSYCESKLANILHMREMAKRYPAIKFMSVHPGIVKTSFFRFSTESEFKGTFVGWWLNTSFVQWLQKSPEQGAQTSMYCICSPEAETGHYYAECAQSKVAIKGKRNLDEAQEELWNLSMKFVEENCQFH